MYPPMDPLPSRNDDPRLDNWYHTIDLGSGLTTRGHFMHRSLADQVGLPESLAGKTCLDVGTADGFWAFEMERRGAARVTAVDLPRHGECDLTPPVRGAMHPEVAANPPFHQMRFATAKAVLKSKVEYRPMSVYDLSPETIGTFEVVYCGSLLLHLFDPLSALIAIRKVTNGYAVIETAADPGLDEVQPDGCYARFGTLGQEKIPGDDVTYWLLSSKTLCQMLRYAGFSSVEPRGLLKMEERTATGFMWVTAAVARV